MKSGNTQMFRQDSNTTEMERKEDGSMFSDGATEFVRGADVSGRDDQSVVRIVEDGSEAGEAGDQSINKMIRQEDRGRLQTVQVNKSVKQNKGDVLEEQSEANFVALPNIR